MYKDACKSSKVERGSTFRCTSDLPYISSISFTHVKIARQWKSTVRVKSRRNDRCYAEVQSGVVFVQAQKLSGIL